MCPDTGANGELLNGFQGQEATSLLVAELARGDGRGYGEVWPLLSRIYLQTAAGSRVTTSG
jgi:hypothetical protein